LREEAYARLARVYDNFMYDVSYADWAEYAAGLLRERTAGNALLEYACGTGGLTLELLRAGFRVTAMDISEDMLDVARAKLRRKAFSPVLACADMADFILNRPADAAVCACDGVNYLLTEERLEAFCRNAYGNIRPGGVLLFDISSAHKLEYVLGDGFFYDDSEGGTLFWQNAYDAASRLIQMDLTLFAAAGSVYDRFDERHIQRAWRREEIGAALEGAGFSRVAALDFPTREQARADSQRIQFVAEKASE
jgi:SAM-dependent methyltransferase